MVTSPTPIDLTVDYAAFGRVPTGYGVQPYREQAGYSDDALVALAPAYAAEGIARWVRHGYVGSQTRDAFEHWAGRIRAAVPGAQTGAAFGYGGFNRDHPEDVGKATADVFGSPLCDLGLDDAESAFDNNAKAKAYAMVQARLSRLGGRPRCPVGNQLWEAIRHHPNFPVVEWLPTTTFFAEQEYGNDWKGPHRWEDARSLRDADWSTENETFPANLLLPHVATTQGYGYALDTGDAQVPWEAVTELLRWPGCTIWCQWALSDAMRMALRFVAHLRAHGYALAPDLSGVRAFQKDAGLPQDGLAGFRTMAAAGITPAARP